MRDNAKSLIATATAHYVNDGALNIFPILYPLLLLHPYNFTNATIGVIAAVLNGSSILASPYIGRRSDVGRNFVTLIIIGVVTISIGAAGFSLAMVYFQGYSLFFVLIPFAFLAGFGSSFYHPLGAAVLNEQWERKNRGRAMGINGSLGSFGILSFPIIAVALITTFSLSSVSALGVFGIGIAVMIYLLMRNVNFGASTKQMARKVIPWKIVMPTILALTVSTFFRSFFSQAIIQFLPVYLIKVNHMQYSYVPLAIAVMPAMGMISQPIFGQLADRIGRRLTLGISTVGSVVTMLLFITTSNIALAEVFLAFFGMFQFTGFPLILALAIEISPKGATTLSNSIVWGFGNVGGATVGPIFLGLLSEPALLGSLTSTFFWMTIIGSISILLVPLIPRPTRTD
ncbi:MAG: MFS transporter [Nitrososphaerales archaeon]